MGLGKGAFGGWENNAHLPHGNVEAQMGKPTSESASPPGCPGAGRPQWRGPGGHMAKGAGPGLALAAQGRRGRKSHGLAPVAGGIWHMEGSLAKESEEMRCCFAECTFRTCANND